MIKIILGTLVSTILLVSVIVVFYWRDIKYDPNGQDFLIFFGVIPAAITLLILSPMLIKKIYQSRQEKKEQQLQIRYLQDYNGPKKISVISKNEMVAIPLS